MDINRVMGGFRSPPRPVGDVRRHSGEEAPAILREIRTFGPNPGALRMWTYVPPVMAERRALVVVLHGCGQTAAGYNYGAGWSTLAQRYGFALLFPEQQLSNNPNGCFNWFEPADTKRGCGEPASVRAMIDIMVRDHRINPDCVFVTGLSAGGAMTSVMLACYPEVFAAGAIIAGLPFGSARNVQQAFQSMFQCPSRPSREWGDFVRQASPRHHGPWPRVSVWHGSGDKTVVPSNAGEVLKQWTDVHGLVETPSARSMVEGYPREVWLTPAGDVAIESYTITNMAHGTPLATGTGESACGVAGPFLLETGISSSYHIANFFGLLGSDDRIVCTPHENDRVALAGSSCRAADQRGILHKEVLEPAPPSFAHPGTTSQRVDIGALITKALVAAGLMKR